MGFLFTRSLYKVLSVHISLYIYCSLSSALKLKKIDSFQFSSVHNDT